MNLHYHGHHAVLGGDGVRGGISIHIYSTAIHWDIVNERNKNYKHPGTLLLIGATFQSFFSISLSRCLDSLRSHQTPQIPPELTAQCPLCCA